MAASSSDKNYRLKLIDIVPQLIQRLPAKLPDLVLGGIPALLQKATDVSSIGKVLEKNAILFRNKPAILFEDKKWTHAQFNAIVNQYAHFFLHQGIQKGQVVIVFLENRPEVLFVVSALAKIGAIASLINSNHRSQVLKHSIHQHNDGYFVVGEELLEAFEDVKDDLVSPRKKVLMGIVDKGEADFPKDYIVVDNKLDKFPTSNLASVQAMQSGTPFAYIFTSGTTGMPKASIQTQHKWLTCMYWFGKVNLGLKSDDVIYVSIPFYHSNALLIAWSSAAISGAAMAIRRKFSVQEFWKDCIKYKATAFIYIGDICRYLYNAKPSDLDQSHGIKKIIGNGLRPDIWKNFKYRFGIEEVYEFYASSEGNMTFTNTLNLDDTVGWCASQFQIVKYDREKGEPIRDSKGFMQKVKWGEIGLMIFEISDKYPFPGYVKKEENDKKLLKNVFKQGDQWYNTGDLMRNIGFWHSQFVDREGDTFRWKGENVATAEVEEIIHQYPGVKLCSVYGVDIPHSDGKAGMAAIKLNANVEWDWNDFSDFLEKELPSYAIPVFVRLVDEFEYTSTYKVIKNTLKTESFHSTPGEVWVKRCKTDKYQKLSKVMLEDILKNGI